MVQRKIIWSNQAKSDIKNILYFFDKRNGSKIYSQKLLTLIRNSIQITAKQPFIGTKTNMKNVRFLVVEDYLLFYKIIADSILVVTVWDCRQNPNNRPFENFI